MWNCGVTIVVCVMIRAVSSITIPSHVQIILDKIPFWEQEAKAAVDGNKCFRPQGCVRKCCPDRQGFDILKNECRVIPDDKFNPPVWKSHSLMKGFDASEELDTLKGKLLCNIQGLFIEEGKKLLATDITPLFHLQSDGKLYVESYRAAGPELVFDHKKYCIDRFITAENKTEWNAFICMLITCFLVLLRVVVFAWLPELRTLHGMILMAYLVSFLVGFLLLGSKLLLMYGHNINRETCVVITFIVYFFILSAFFWRNVMCYDIWWTFSGKRAMSGRGSASRTRLYLYCAYAFGCPTALTILLAALEYSDFPREHALIPKLRHHGCNSLYGFSKLLYFYGPIIILFVINIVLFTITALKIAAIKKETKIILQSKESGSRDRKNDRRRFTLYVKLFAAMVFLEVNWVLEIVAIFYPEQQIILQITDVYNVVILLVILLNFLCQKQTWIMIKKRYNQMRGLPSSVQRTGVPTGRTLSSQTSQSQDDTQSTVYSRGKMNPSDSQEDTQSTDYSREKTSPTDSLEDTQSTDSSREKTNPADSQDDTQSTDYSREKTSPTDSLDDTQSTDYSQEKTNPGDSHDNTQSTDYTKEKVNLAANQDDTQSTDCSREKRNRTDSHYDTLSTDYIRDKTNPADSQDDTQSTDCSREKTNSAQNQDDTQSKAYSREKMICTDSHDDTPSTDYNREKTNPADSQDDTQSTDCSREMTNSAQNQEDTQSNDYSQEKVKPAETCRTPGPIVIGL